VKRFAFLDWMRGLAVVLMIQCHTFNSFSRLDVRDGGPYNLSQFIGGMAAPLFLLMAGMTLAFQMESMARREPLAMRRWLHAFRRGGYVLGIAFLFRLTNWLFSLPDASLQELTKVDILNCMGVAMIALSALSVAPSRTRAQWAAAAGLLIAAAAPVVSNLNWSGMPQLLHEYLAPGVGRGRFAFFPCAAYVGFGISLGTIVKRTSLENIERLMLWSVAVGVILTYGAQYFSNLPYSPYPASNFWTDSPALILIRLGICLMMMAGSYLWTEHCAGGGWSGMIVFGKTSLMVYWVHVVMVYGPSTRMFRRALGISGAAAATLGVMALMLALAEMQLRWGAWRAARAGAPAEKR
jgi:uncharacterized membrane protein